MSSRKGPPVLEDVTAVMVTYNSAAVLSKTLPDLARINLKIIVVDNSSTDETLDLVRRLHPAATVVNTGFSSSVALPAVSAASRASTWCEGELHTTTASTSGSSARAFAVAWKRSPCSAAWASP